MAKQRAPALPDSLSFQQLWDALGSKLIEAAQERLLYTQGVTSSSLVPPTTTPPQALSLTAYSHHPSRDASLVPPTSAIPPEALSSATFTHRLTEDASPLPPTTHNPLNFG
jgi:hypothetical protein